MRIDLLVQKSVCSNFFADSANYVSNATVHSSNGINSFFYSNDQNDMPCQRRYFRLHTICSNYKNEDWFTCAKIGLFKFFADFANYVSNATFHSSNGIKSFFYSNDQDDLLCHRWIFSLTTISRNNKISIYFLVRKSCCSKLFADSVNYVFNATVHNKGK